jgi:hypothetical protein
VQRPRGGRYRKRAAQIVPRSSPISIR